MELIPKRLIECREKNNLSKREAAKIIGVSQPAYLRYETGERAPSIQVIKEIAKAFHTSAEYLTGENDDSSSNILEISKDQNLELFEIMQKCNDMDSEQLQRVLVYAEKISKMNK